MKSTERATQLSQTRDRRSFLKACGILGLGAAAGGVLQAAGKVINLGGGLSSVSETRLAMGTYVAMTAVHPSKDHARDAIGQAFGEIERLIAIFSRHDSSTPLSILNRDGALADPPAELVELVRESHRFHVLSHGAFDITVKPLIDLFTDTADGAEAALPSAEEIHSALARVGSEKIEIGPRRIRFVEPGMGITLDGIAKGYIVDCASRVLASSGIQSHLVNAGGDIRAHGARGGGQPWTIAVQDPQKQGNYPEVIRLSSGAVATSGNYEIFYDSEKLFHHLVDPHTGMSPRDSVSVTALAGSAMQADALSTSVFILGPHEGTRLIDSLPKSECLALNGQGKQFRSRGWRSAAGIRA